MVAEDFYFTKCAVNVSTVAVNGLFMFGYIAIVHFQGKLTHAHN